MPSIFEWSCNVLPQTPSWWTHAQLYLHEQFPKCSTHHF